MDYTLALIGFLRIWFILLIFVFVLFPFFFLYYVKYGTYKEMNNDEVNLPAFPRVKMNGKAAINKMKQLRFEADKRYKYSFFVSLSKNKENYYNITNFGCFIEDYLKNYVHASIVIIDGKIIDFSFIQYLKFCYHLRKWWKEEINKKEGHHHEIH